MKNKKMLFLIFFVLIERIIFYIHYQRLWWDAAVYIGMGKFLFSSGKIGVFEPMRPLLMPFLYGLSWKIGLDPIIIGKILDSFFIVGIVLLSFLIIKITHDENTAFISSLIIALSPLLFFISFNIYTDLPSIFFILCSFLFFLKKEKSINILFSGIFAGLGFLTRYPLALILIAINLFLFIEWWKNISWKNFKQILFLNLGFVLAISPYLIFNFVKFGNILYLFYNANSWYRANLGNIFNIGSVEWAGGEHFLFKKDAFIYLKTIIVLFNFLLPFLIYGLINQYKKNKKIFWYFFLPFLLLFVYFQTFFLKGERLILPATIFLSFFAAIGYSKIKFKKKKLFILAYSLIFIIFSIALYISLPNGPTQYDSFFLNKNYSCNSVVSADPYSALNYLVLYPYEEFTDRHMEEYSAWQPSENILKRKADCIFYYSCSESRENHIEKIVNIGYNIIYHKPWGNCDFFVFKNQTSLIT